MEEANTNFLYGIAWTILGAVLLIIFTQLIIYLRERWTKGIDSGTALILKDIEALRMQNQHGQELIKKDLNNFTDMINRFQKHMESTDEKQGQMDRRMGSAETSIGQLKEKIKENNELIFKIEKELLNSGIR